MTAKEKQSSKRTERHVAMLQEALQCPGVREVMDVYGAWQRLESELSRYRAATVAPPRITTTDRANVP